MTAFVGRDAEIALLEGAVDEAVSGRARVVVVSGAAGSGKTWLVRELLRRRPSVPARSATGDPHETGVRFGVVTQLFGTAVLDPGPGQEAGGASADPVTVGARVLAGIAEPASPRLLVVDDAQWSDLPSLRSLLFVLRRLTTEPVCLLLLGRPPLPTPLHGFVEGAALTDGSSLHLQGLDERATAALATRLGRDDLSRSQLRDLVRHTGGNPLHLTELLTDWSTRQLTGAPLVLPAPRSLSALVQARLASCSTSAARLVAASVVRGGEAGLLDLTALVDLPDPLAALDEAVAAGLLRRRGSSPDVRVAPPHDLLATAVTEHLPSTLLAAVHASAAASAPDDVARLRHLLAAATGRSDPLLVERVRRRTAELTCTGDASRAFRLTAAAAGLVVDAAVRSEVLLDAAAQALAASEPGAAAALLAEVPAETSPARSAFLRGVLALHQRDHTRAEQQLRLAWASASDDQEELRHDIAGQLAGLELLLGRGTSCAAWAARSRPAVHMLFPPEGLAAMGLAVAGRPLDALRLLAPPGAERQGGVVPVEELGALAARGIVEMYVDDLTGARQDLRAADAAAARTGLVFTRSYVLASLAEVEHRTGDWDAALVHSQSAVAIVVDADVQAHLAPVSALAVPVPARRGQWEAAGAHVAVALDVAQDGGAQVDRAYAADAAALLAAAQGDHDGVLRATEPLLRLGGDGVREPGIFSWRQLRTAALVQLRRLDEAEVELEDQEQLARRRGHRSSAAAAAHVRGLLETARGHRSSAEAAFSTALRMHRELQLPFEQAVVRASYGRALRRWGAHGPAAAQLRAAAECFRALRAGPFLRQVEEQLQDVVPPTTAVDEQLTPQQVAVAQLVTAGMRNREIAAELFVSVKTVEYHLHEIYSKLGLASRSQLVRVMSSSTGGAHPA